jgi:hypothetical protein
VCTSGSAIVLGDGTFDATNYFSRYITNKEVSVLGNGATTTITFPGQPDSHSTPVGTLSLYKMILKSRTASFAFLASDTGTIKAYVKLHNVVLNDHINQRQVESKNWGSGGDSKSVSISAYNCIFDCNNYFSTNFDMLQNCATVNGSYYGASITSNITSLLNTGFDTSYNIKNNGWQNSGTGINPDGSKANIGVYGGEFAWGFEAPNIDVVSNKKVGINSEFTTDIVLHNVYNICAEDIKVTYDLNLFQYEGATPTEGLKIYKESVQPDGTIRFIVASL